MNPDAQTLVENLENNGACFAIINEFQVSSTRLDKLVKDLKLEKIKICDYMGDPESPKNKYAIMHAKTIQREISISLENLYKLNSALNELITEKQKVTT